MSDLSDAVERVFAEGRRLCAGDGWMINHRGERSSIPRPGCPACLPFKQPASNPNPDKEEVR